MTFPVYHFKRAIPLRNEAYNAWLWNRIAAAHQRIWLSVFIFNAATAHDTAYQVRDMAKHLAYARWRNVDVRVLLGQSHIGAIQIQNTVAAEFLASMRIEARFFDSAENTSLHSKYVVFDDDWVVVGSNNWSPGGFAGNNEDALAMSSADLNTSLSLNFLKNWHDASAKKGAGYEQHVV